MTRRRALVFTTGALALLVLTGCGAAAEAPANDGAAAEPDAAPTCETLITPSLIEDLEGLGWSAKEEPFMVGATEVDGGIQCKWGDPEGAGETLQIYGWAPVDADAAADYQDQLEAEGWIREEQDGSVFLTEDPSMAFQVDEEGYGYTYGFAEGWMAVSDTKSGLAVIRWPR